ncbi:MAG TPA: hypothetical protein VE085_03020 [Burkholderiales bacterium]|nr:hypothetical protein [Burkholderiales bacterium]
MDLGRLLLGYKNNASPEERFSLSVADAEGRRIGSLVCLDRGLSGDARVVAKLTEWRQRHMRHFLTQFVATSERTLAWVQRIVLPSQDRILFLVYTAEGDLVGNCGVCDLGPSYGALDNVIRGEKGGAARLIYFSEIALLSWLYGALGCQRVGLQVFSNNDRAIALYSSIGLTVARRRKLTFSDHADGRTYHIDSRLGDPAGFDCLEMALEKGAFLRAHPWVRHVYPEDFRSA